MNAFISASCSFAMKKRLEAKAKIEAGKKKIEWGSQIRSYVFSSAFAFNANTARSASVKIFFIVLIYC